jgi:hypothetical protein
MAEVEALLSVLVVPLSVGCGPSALWKLALGFAVLVSRVVEVRRDWCTLVDVELSRSIVCCSVFDVECGFWVFVENTTGNTGVLLVRWLCFVFDKDVCFLFTDKRQTS